MTILFGQYVKPQLKISPTNQPGDPHNLAKICTRKPTKEFKRSPP
jgi:hypothetical protein